jgi:hypothetical protein
MLRSIDRPYLPLTPVALALAALAAGCLNLPEPKVTQASVVQAAKAVIADRYPMHSISEESGVILALSPVHLDGSSRMRKQIAVHVKRNYTGSFDADISVRKWVAMERSHMTGDPEAPSPVEAQPLVSTEWQFLDSLPYEEQELYEAIQQRLQPKGI